MISLPRKYSFAIRLYSHRHTCSQALQVLPATTLPPTCVRQGRMNDFCSPAQSSPAQTPPALTLLYFLPRYLYSPSPSLTCTRNISSPLPACLSLFLSSHEPTLSYTVYLPIYTGLISPHRQTLHLPSNLCGSSKSCKTQRNLGQAPMDVFPEAETRSHVLPVLVSVANEMLSIQRRRLHSTLWWRSSRLLWELVGSGRSHFPSSYAAGIRNCFTSPSSLSSSTTTRCTTLAHCHLTTRCHLVWGR